MTLGLGWCVGGYAVHDLFEVEKAGSGCASGDPVPPLIRLFKK